MAVKKRSPTKKQLRYIEDFVVKQLENKDLKPWQDACKSLAPPNYDHITRTKWFEENKFRAEVGRDVVEVVENMTATLQEVELLETIRVTDIRSAVIKGVRRAEKDQDITQYLLNDVKFATLRTIVGWVDHPERRKGTRSKSIEKSRRGRKKEKGRHRPPGIDIVKEWEIVTNDTIRITSVISNYYLHPYQNVELEVDFGPNLTVTSVSPFSWLPDEKRIRIGCLESGLGVEHLETEFSIDLTIRERVETNTISCRIHFDNCDKGVRDVSKRSKTTISLV
ncbi:MAG: hypothetical protein RTU63_01910 [Candidatus Thorarchaeota archaeon]